ncbi:MAG: hypothetical protein CME59_04860 [Halioglobus sp.]|nr:hypothetical protein [Halioglobus sp.]
MDRELPPPVDMPRLSPYPGAEPAAPLRQSTRARLFGITFLVALALGLLLTLLQPALYRASATVLMSAPADIDDDAQNADIQSVAIQRRILLGGEVTAALLQAMGPGTPQHVDASYLRQVLRVDPVADTNLVEMSAQGEDGDLLPALVDTWIDVYLEVRAAEIARSQAQTEERVQGQLSGLEARLEAARDALADYRQEHDISSAERQENEVVARLEGLNTARNKALENEVTARAYLQTLERAIAGGKKVVPVSERDGVAAMERELSQLKQTLANLSKNYTMEYIRRQPRFRDIPDRIAQLEGDLAEVYDQGQAIELAAAQQRYAAARQAAQELQAQLDAHEQEAARFTSIYARHQALVEDLARLEELNRQTQSRLVEVQVNAADRYPQVSVIDRPGAHSTRLGPDYRLWLGGTLAAALLLAVLAVWLYGFLGPRRQPAYVTLSGVHMYPAEAAGQIAQAPLAGQALGHAGTPLLDDAAAPAGDHDEQDNNSDTAQDDAEPPRG